MKGKYTPHLDANLLLDQRPSQIGFPSLSEVMLLPQILATKILLHCLAPDCAALVEMHLWSIACFEAVDGFGEFFGETFLFDVLDRRQICLECEDQSL